MGKCREEYERVYKPMREAWDRRNKLMDAALESMSNLEIREKGVDIYRWLPSREDGDDGDE